MGCLGKNYFGLGVRQLAAMAAAALSAGYSCAADFHFVDFSSSHNYRLQDMDGDAHLLPTGQISAGGTPFYIPTGTGNNAYLSAQPPGGGVRTLDVSIGWFGVSEVHTLINSWWGTWSPSAYASLEFFGSGGAYFKYNLVGNKDIRDYLYSDYTNAIDGTNTVNAVTIGDAKYHQVRLDAQTVVLPAAFRVQTLTKMRLNDQGDMGFQRTFLSGVTVATVPEPSTLTAIGACAIALQIRRRRMKK